MRVQRREANSGKLLMLILVLSVITSVLYSYSNVLKEEYYFTGLNLAVYNVLIPALSIVAGWFVAGVSLYKIKTINQTVTVRVIKFTKIIFIVYISLMTPLIIIAILGCLELSMGIQAGEGGIESIRLMVGSQLYATIVLSISKWMERWALLLFVLGVALKYSELNNKVDCI